MTAGGESEQRVLRWGGRWGLSAPYSSGDGLMMAQRRRTAFSFRQGPRDSLERCVRLAESTRSWVTVLTDAMMFVIGSVAMLAAPAYFILQPWAVSKLTGGWRKAALLPLIPAFPLVLWCAYALADQSNLWPVPFLLFAPFGTFYLAILLVVAQMRALRNGN